MIIQCFTQCNLISLYFDFIRLQSTELSKQTYQQQSCPHDLKLFGMMAPLQILHIYNVQLLINSPIEARPHCLWNCEAETIFSICSNVFRQFRGNYMDSVLIIHYSSMPVEKIPFIFL